MTSKANKQIFLVPKKLLSKFYVVFKYLIKKFIYLI